MDTNLELNQRNATQAESIMELEAELKATVFREDELHIAICQAVSLLNMSSDDEGRRRAHSILRQVLSDYADWKEGRLPVSQSVSEGTVK